MTLKNKSVPQPYDLFSAQFKADPFPTYAQMRLRHPIYAHRTPNGTTIWYITRYDDVLAVLQDDEHFCKDPRHSGLSTANSRPVRRTAIHRLINENMLFSDPPDHTRLRSLVSQTFTPQRIAHQAGLITETAESLIDGFRFKGGVDLIAAFAFPLPVYVISKLLGIPDEDIQLIAGWSQAIISPGSRNLNFTQRRQQVQALVRYLNDMFSVRRAEPQDDLISDLVHAEQAGDKLSEFELSSMVVLLLVTGHETTVNLIGNGALALIQNPDQLNQLRNEPNLWDSAIEEILRYDGPVETSTSRWARKDVLIDGQLIKRGDSVRIVLTSANRDPSHFDSAGALLLERKANKHLAFGYGIHYCLGAPLARMEGKIALRTLFDSLGKIKLVSAPDRLCWRSGVLFRGLEKLEVFWQN